MERARGCFRHLKSVFQELEEIRPFELLKGQGDRINYLMSKQVGGEASNTEVGKDERKGLGMCPIGLLQGQGDRINYFM